MTEKRNRGRTVDGPFFRIFSLPQAGEKRSAGTRSHRMKFCVQKGLGESPTSSARSRMAILGHCLPLSWRYKNSQREKLPSFTHWPILFQVS